MAGQGILDLFKAKKREPKKNPVRSSNGSTTPATILEELVTDEGLEAVLEALSTCAVGIDGSVDREAQEKIQGVLLVLADIAAGEDVDDEEIDEDEDEDEDEEEDLDEDDLPEEAEDDSDESGDE